MKIRRQFSMFTVLVAAPCVTGCIGFVPPNTDLNSPPTDDSELPALQLRLIHTGLDRPVDLQSPADGTDRLFIVEQVGRIRIISNGQLQSPDDAFLDITDQVVRSGGEQGLLGLAFHPDFATNGQFYVNFTAASGNATATMIAEFTADPGGDRAAPETMRVILEVDQPFANHNGGQLQFGPDGMLYAGLGDGGLACDSLDAAQDPQSLLGKMLRLDVNADPPFIPLDNPFTTDADTRDEIWALGLRNPFRFSFDPDGTHMFIADVGQNAVEEISVLDVSGDAGANLGWPAREGTLAPPPGCSGTNFDVFDPVDPVLEYTHDDGCSIIGGYVWTDTTASALVGAYLFSDFCTPFVRALLPQDDGTFVQQDLTDRIETDASALDNPASFGRDQQGQVYILDLDGDIFLLAPTAETNG